MWLSRTLRAEIKLHADVPSQEQISKVLPFKHPLNKQVLYEQTSLISNLYKNTRWTHNETRSTQVMENIGSVTEARTKYRNKMYVYRCIRQSGYVLEFAKVRDDLYQCTQCKRLRKSRSVKIINDAVVPGNQHPEDGHHASCKPMPESGMATGLHVLLQDCF